MAASSLDYGAARSGIRRTRVIRHCTGGIHSVRGPNGSRLSVGDRVCTSTTGTENRGVHNPATKSVDVNAAATGSPRASWNIQCVSGGGERRDQLFEYARYTHWLGRVPAKRSGRSAGGSLASSKWPSVDHFGPPPSVGQASSVPVLSAANPYRRHPIRPTAHRTSRNTAEIPDAELNVHGAPWLVERRSCRRSDPGSCIRPLSGPSMPGAAVTLRKSACGTRPSTASPDHRISIIFTTRTVLVPGSGPSWTV